MDSIFGIGGPELIFILLLAGIVMGPDRIYKVAKWLGKTTAQMQAISRGFARQLSAELDAVDSGGEIKSAAREMQDLQRQIQELRTELKDVVGGPAREARDALKESEALIENSIRPPQPKNGADEQDQNQNGTAVGAAAEPSNAIKPIKPLPTPTPPENLPRVVEVEDDPE